jgi:hypothetical protein
LRRPCQFAGDHGWWRFLTSFRNRKEEKCLSL